MPTITWSTIATSNPMGQQVYEREIRHALRQIAQNEWTFRDVRVCPMRTSLAEAVRVPTRFVQHVPLTVARAVGGLVYRSTDLVHRLDLRLPPALGPEVITVHDLPPLRFPDEGRLPASAAAGARRARMVICPSGFSADEVRGLLGVKRIEVIPYGLSPVFRDPVPADDATLARLGIRRRFVLHAAGATARKNLPELARAWGDVAERYRDAQLVLCGPPDRRRDAAFAGLERVVLAGHLSPNEVASLMARAAVVVVPSVYEGFGLPALEGMACGAPVVAARAGALPEVCGDAAILVEPTAPALADGLSAVLGERALAEELSAAGPPHASRFSWSAAADAHLSVYLAAIQRVIA
jgi:glycosyltransferase involved in cell wall biosynthesis